MERSRDIRNMRRLNGHNIAAKKQKEKVKENYKEKNVLDRQGFKRNPEW